ncbi:MAG: hypothetical protein GC179_04185 [Anaerolineaceae bacterium]|nr:hypothetical protein [Anaerolineaceae bacterium]
MTDLVLHMTPEQQQRIEATARKRGYQSLDDYLLALAELDAQGDLMLKDTDDLTKEQLEANFRQGLHEVVSGKTYPIDQLWDMVDAE